MHPELVEGALCSLSLSKGPERVARLKRTHADLFEALRQLRGHMGEPFDRLRGHMDESSGGIWMSPSTSSGGGGRWRGGGRGAGEVLFDDDLAGVEVLTGVHGGEEAVDHVDAGGGDVLLEPLGVFGAHRVVVGKGARHVDESLLNG